MALRADQRAHFLGMPDDDYTSLAKKCVAGVEETGETRAIVLATDGISERGIGVDVPSTTVFDCVARAQRVDADLRALEIARSVAEAANAAHQRHRSGDDIATAALWMGA
ncbi:MAG: hypothetical protein HRU01_22795 [Myxococcales bacterium]|nr:hypothetical protein [Myxococcales bacterium]